MSSLRAWWGRCSVVAAVLATSLAAAQPAPDDAATLLDRGRTLFDEHRYAEACPLLERSFQLSGELETLFGFAACQEAIGLTTSAYEDFRTIARGDPQGPWGELARARQEALEPRIARIRIVVEERVPGLQLLDEEGQPIPADQELLVDPGLFVVEVVAPDHPPLQREVQVGEGQSIEIRIPPLEPRVALPLPDPVVVPPPPRPAPPPRRGDRSPDDNTPFEIATIVLVGTGAIFAVAATGLMVDTIDAKEEAACNPDCTTPEAQEMYDDAQTGQYVSIGMGAIGGACAIVGTGMLISWLTDDDPTGRAWHLQPAIALDGSLGATLRATW